MDALRAVAAMNVDPRITPVSAELLTKIREVLLSGGELETMLGYLLTAFVDLETNTVKVETHIRQVELLTNAVSVLGDGNGQIMGLIARIVDRIEPV